MRIMCERISASLSLAHTFTNFRFLFITIFERVSFLTANFCCCSSILKIMRLRYAHFYEWKSEWETYEWTYEWMSNRTRVNGWITIECWMNAERDEKTATTVTTQSFFFSVDCGFLGRPSRSRCLCRSHRLTCRCWLVVTLCWRDSTCSKHAMHTRFLLTREDEERQTITAQNSSRQQASSVSCFSVLFFSSRSFDFVNYHFSYFFFSVSTLTTRCVEMEKFDAEASKVWHNS